MDYGEKYKKKAAATNAMLLKYFDDIMARTPEEKKKDRQGELLRILKESRRGFEEKVSKYLWDAGAGTCPDGYKKCRDGVCVPEGEGCDDWMSN